MTEDYPTNYEDGEKIEGNVEQWLEKQSEEELAQQLNRFHKYQLQWFSLNTDDPKKKAILDGEVQAREDYDTSSTSSSSTNGTRTGVWDSGLEILENFKDLAEHKIGARSLEQYAKKELGVETNKVILPEEVRKICVAIQEEVNSDAGGKCEWGALFKGEWTSDGFKVKPDYVIPEQKASRAHITYTEDLKKYRDEGYIVNIHSHPWAGTSSGFSGTDDDHINSHFDMAVLYAGKAETFADAVAIVEVDDGVNARISPEVEVEKPERKLPEIEGLDNVTTRSTNYSSRKKNRSIDYGKRYGTPPKGSYEHYKKNYVSEDDEKQGLPQSPDELDDEQVAFTEVDFYR